VKKTISLTIMLCIVWLLWSGHYTFMITSFGAASVILCVWLAHRMKIIDEEGHPVHLALAHVTYGPWLLWQIVLANIDVSRRVLTGDISPRWVRIKAPQRTALGRVIYANSIIRFIETSGRTWRVETWLGESARSRAATDVCCRLDRNFAVHGASARSRLERPHRF
jgi:multicomponent Na+:H+ antiporter subunit E